MVQISIRKVNSADSQKMVYSYFGYVIFQYSY